MLFLSQPSALYKDSFLQSVQEFQAEGRRQSFDLHRMTADFPAFVQSLLDQADGNKVVAGKVPASHFWLIDDDEFIGMLNIRHELIEYLFKADGHIGYEIRPSKRKRGYGKEILRLGLEKARDLGFRRVLVTCDETNIGSKKIIEYNGGVFENAIGVGSPIKKLRYWIDID